MKEGLLLVPATRHFGTPSSSCKHSFLGLVEKYCGSDICRVKPYFIERMTHGQTNNTLPTRSARSALVFLHENTSVHRVLNVGTTSVLGVGKILEEEVFGQKLSCVWAKVVTSLGVRSYKFR